MKQQPKFITHNGFPATVVMALLVLLFSSPLYSKTAPKHVPSIDFEHGTFVSLDAFASAFGVTPHATAANHKLTLSILGRPVVLTRLSSVIKIDQELYRMPSALMSYNGQMYIPEQAVLQIAKQFHTPISLQKTDKPVLATKSTPSPYTNTFSPTPQQPKVDVAQNAANWTLKTVVIDPGHGGKDPGALGHGGAHEKAIVLEVGKRLKKLLEKRLGVHVVLTRDDDTFIPLGTRSKMAIQKGGKVFISLHCNAAENRRANGMEVYFLSEAKTKDAAQVAQNENAVLEKYEGVSIDSLTKDVDRIRYSLLSSQFLKESQDLAADIHNAIAGQIPQVKPRGVKQANFYVMRGTMGQMPSVLVELGFVTNRDEEKQLKSNNHQKKLAEALYEGIKKFKQRYEQQLTADSS